MSERHQALIERLKASLQSVEPQDTMAEAGRKALLADFIRIMETEEGSRAGEDIEAVHDMRVATRRMRSTFRLLAKYYKPKAIQPHLDGLREVAQALGGVRDLDVMIEEIDHFAATLENGGELQPILDQLNRQRDKARKSLIKLLDKRNYARFVDDFSAFLLKPGKGALPVDADEIQPFQVRHLLPELLYEHLGAVKAYDDVLADADNATLHALRIEFKRLRYAVSIFSDVLGTGIGDFITEIKAVQDHLGRLNDLHTAQERLNEIARKLDHDAQMETLTALQQYIAHLEEEWHSQREGVDQVWARFNTKTVQRQLSNAIVSL